MRTQPVRIPEVRRRCGSPPAAAVAAVAGFGAASVGYSVCVLGERGGAWGGWGLERSGDNNVYVRRGRLQRRRWRPMQVVGGYGGRSYWAQVAAAGGCRSWPGVASCGLLELAVARRGWLELAGCGCGWPQLAVACLGACGCVLAGRGRLMA
jgi:hypothetical protein